MCFRLTIRPYFEFPDGRKKVHFGNTDLLKKFDDLYSADFDFARFNKLRNELIGKSYFDLRMNERVKLLDLIPIPCGKCSACLKQRSENMATRVICENMHNKSFNKDSSLFFVTLTYIDKFLPKNNSLSKRDLQLFFKRLRKNFDLDFKYFACGEYGSVNGRPHYHVIFIFNKHVDSNYMLKCLKSEWTFGLIDLQEAPSDKAIYYTARYCDKKIESNLSVADYRKLGIEAPFLSSSKNLGFSYFKAHRDEILDLGYIQLADGKRASIPPYFLKKLDSDFIEQYKLENRNKSYVNLSHNLQAGKINFGSLFKYNLTLDNNLFRKKKILKRK